MRLALSLPFIFLFSIAGCSPIPSVVKTTYDPKEGADSQSKTQSPTTSAPSQQPLIDDKVAKPITVTGAFLACFSEPSYDGLAAETNVNCALRDGFPNVKKVQLGADASQYSWGFGANPNLSVTVAELPSTSTWHVRYTIKAASADVLKAQVSQLDFNAHVNTKSNDQTAVDSKANIMAEGSLDDNFIRPKIAPKYCLNFRKGPTTPGSDFLVDPCDGNEKSQQMKITLAQTLAAQDESCLSDIGVVACNQLAKQAIWVYDGVHLKMKDSNLCLNYSIIAHFEDCVAGKAGQEWILGKKVLEQALLR
ncbi:MAG: hypothetical protein EOP04_26715 [Proteobacteria bacterium]|nr:MAG: hypothetical protein EOP04_26715 [Pseudomonadota bacterium]